ncbi:glycosyltransferase family 2 protein [Paenibacillus glufosinatiresistens]|uniref:glycosyltransferase family 2 protein n=1 Tax=Paenibacillus glufosinatiresistens TaxID=3070657 RepID=UPI00286DC3D4|nr:glycosyltransferase [Paenibacillus sp. YX.27]
MDGFWRLSIAICTRNRHDDLLRCLKSLYSQRIEDARIELMLIDDGETSRSWLDGAREQAPEWVDLIYYRKNPAEAGLIRSRLYAVRAARNEMLLFLDDDVELAPDYLSQLRATLAAHPEAVGVGGVDQGFSCSLKGRMLMLLSGRGRLSPGKLSYSGFASSMNLWNRQKRTFRTEFLHGCNMCFRRSALSGAEAEEWLTGYSLGEDLYLSFIAGRSGPMLVNPAMRLLHHGSPASRDRREQVSYSKVVNHYELLRLRTPMTRLRYGMLLWTVGFLYAETRLRRDAEASRGYRRGLERLRAVMSGQSDSWAGRSKLPAD